MNPADVVRGSMRRLRRASRGSSGSEPPSNRLFDRRAEERAARLEVLVALGGSPEALEDAAPRPRREPLSLDSRVRSYSWVAGRPAAPAAGERDPEPAPEPVPRAAAVPRPQRAPRPRRQRRPVRLPVRRVSAALVAVAAAAGRAARRVARIAARLLLGAVRLAAPALTRAASRFAAALRRRARRPSPPRLLPRPAAAERAEPVVEAESGLTAEQRRLVEAYAVDDTA